MAFFTGKSGNWKHNYYLVWPEYICHFKYVMTAFCNFTFFTSHHPIWYNRSWIALFIKPREPLLCCSMYMISHIILLMPNLRTTMRPLLAASNMSSSQPNVAHVSHNIHVLTSMGNWCTRQCWGCAPHDANTWCSHMLEKCQNTGNFLKDSVKFVHFLYTFLCTHKYDINGGLWVKVTRWKHKISFNSLIQWSNQ